MRLAVLALGLAISATPVIAWADITLETGNDSGSPLNDAAHQNVCAERGPPPPTAGATKGGTATAPRNHEGGFGLGVSSLTSTSSSTTSKDMISGGAYRICYSFAATGPQLPEFAWTWLSWASWVVGAIIQGQIYLSHPVTGAAIVARQTTTLQQDMNWVSYMDSRIGRQDGYSIIRHNCRTFSQWEFRDAPLHW